MVPTYAATRWGIIIRKDDRKFRVRFSARRTQQALGAALFAIPQARRLEIFDELGTDANFAWNPKSKIYATADGCELMFSGLTEREIKNEPAAA